MNLEVGKTERNKFHCNPITIEETISTCTAQLLAKLHLCCDEKLPEMKIFSGLVDKKSVSPIFGLQLSNSFCPSTYPFEIFSPLIVTIVPGDFYHK